MKVRDIMVRAVTTVTSGTPVKNVLLVFLERKLHSAPVVNEEGVLVGVVSIRDLLKVLVGQYFNINTNDLTEETLLLFIEKRRNRPPETPSSDCAIDLRDTLTVDDIMTSEVHSIGENDLVMRAIMVMYQHNIVRMPVVDAQHRVVGVISQSDVMRVAFTLARRQGA